MEVEMHDINRTQMETGWETELAGESAYENYEYEMYPETYGETYGEFESSYGEISGPLGEAEEMELAAEFQEISNEQELDRFIGNLFKKATRFVGKMLPPGVGKSLGGMVKGLAKQILPVAGAALGNLALPGIGGMVGGQAASAVSQALGLELEGLSPEDQEFEIARGYVRLVSDAAQEAANIPPTVPPQVAAKQAMQTAAEKHAPGLIAGTPGQVSMPAQQMAGQPRNNRGTRRSGRWVRTGRRLIILDL
jgi:hypothetical protein